MTPFFFFFFGGLLVAAAHQQMLFLFFGPFLAFQTTRRPALFYSFLAPQTSFFFEYWHTGKKDTACFLPYFFFSSPAPKSGGRYRPFLPFLIPPFWLVGWTIASPFLYFIDVQSRLTLLLFLSFRKGQRNQDIGFLSLPLSRLKAGILPLSPFFSLASPPPCFP